MLSVMRDPGDTPAQEHADCDWTAAQVIGWWEIRRLVYNAVLLVTGVAAIAGMEWLISPSIPVGKDAVEPMLLSIGVVAYGLLANVCYTFGWVLELWARKQNSQVARAQGRFCFKAGMIFSVLLTGLPFYWASIYRLLHWVHA